MPVEIVPTTQRDIEAEIADSKTTMDEAEHAYHQARQHWLDLNHEAGHPITTQPRWT